MLPLVYMCHLYTDWQSKTFLIDSQTEECSCYILKILVNLSFNVLKEGSSKKNRIKVGNFDRPCSTDDKIYGPLRIDFETSIHKNNNCWKLYSFDHFGCEEYINTLLCWILKLIYETAI